MRIELYHGSTMLVEFPEIRKIKYKKFSFVTGTGLSCLCRK